MARNHERELVEYGKAAKGCSTILPATSKIILAGTTYLPSQLGQIFLDAVAGIEAIIQDAAKLKADQAAEKVAAAAAHKLFLQLQTHLVSEWGDGNPQLAQFGMKGRKAAVTTVAKKAAGAKQSLETRKALGTMGSKQRQLAKAKAKAGKSPGGGTTGSSGA